MERLRGIKIIFKPFWTRKKIINIFVFLAFLIVFYYIINMPLDRFLWGASEIKYNAGGAVNGLTYFGSNGYYLPSFSYEYIVNFSAIGSFSVNNPVTVDVIIRNVSLPNLLNYCQVAGFSQAYDYPFSFNNEGSINSSRISLTYVGNDAHYGDTYRGSGTIIWMQEGIKYGVIISPSESINLPMEDIISSFPEIITISGVADTLTQTYTENTNKLAVTIGSFSILILVPILEAIFVKEEKASQ